MPVTSTCVICGKQFTQIPSRAAVVHTCGSPDCKRANRTGSRNPFYGRSHSDATRERISAVKRGERVHVVCACGCGVEFDIPVYRTRTRKIDKHFLNRAHYEAWLEADNHWNYRGGHHPYGPGWAKIASAVRERDGVCQMCGKTPEENGRALDVHHKEPLRSSLNNDMSNLVALCMVCHHAVTRLEEIEYAPLHIFPRKCLQCGKIFTPHVPRIQICSPECKRAARRAKEKRLRQNHPDYYARRRAYSAQWQKDHKEQVNASHQKQRALKREHPTTS